MPSHQSPSANLGYLSQSCESPMFVGPPGVWGDWTNAMRSFEELVDQYETEALQLDDSSLASIEANITRSLCIVIACKPLMARSLMAPWLRVVGLSQPNIQYLEISGVIDLNVLFMKAEKDLRSLADRGKFHQEMKRKFIRSTIAAQKCLEAFKG
ncbi:hypothetical protein Y032_0017g3412 [Ancylostoma ceylanicum]|nr:hypothetical protein Y032_0017g3412 [Ancylostoma ceylanicum]